MRVDYLLHGRIIRVITITLLPYEVSVRGSACPSIYQLRRRLNIFTMPNMMLKLMQKSSRCTYMGNKSFKQKGLGGRRTKINNNFLPKQNKKKKAANLTAKTR